MNRHLHLMTAPPAKANQRATSSPLMSQLYLQDLSSLYPITRIYQESDRT